ncbi:type II toxin-antitoxin system RelE/ParE family toxin [Kosakonia cowanii]|nr:type II toxin-antitoxin system RelE/ParE family toxin [Kosakonia cowanii]WKW44091.1 type II toxin-antitoxin system RelE/ParE family toxin [Kosakonia cowanii]
MWQVEMTETFDEWFFTLGERERASVLAGLMVLKVKGPLLPRPYADTVKGSRYPNMKELRVQSNGQPLRIFFAFDPSRRGILLCAGNKAGYDKRFYEVMIPVADREFTLHLQKIDKRS